MNAFRVLVVFLFALTIVHAQEPVARKGLLDARSFNLKQSKLPLTGELIHYDGELVSPSGFKNDHANYVSFPKLWNDFRNTKSGIGFTTYKLTVLLPQQSDSLALEIPQIYSSYKIWINGKLIARNGIVSTSKIETIPQWMPQTVPFQNENDTLSVVIQIANFHHHNGGAKETIYLGTESNLMKFRKRAVISNLGEATVLTILSISFAFVYFRNKKQKVIIYFLLLCLTWAIRSLFSNLYLTVSFFPDFNWELMVKIEYLTLYLTMTWAILFLGRLFIHESSKIVKYFLVVGNIFFVVFTLITPALIYTRWLPAYLGFSVILIVYGLVVVIMALINDRAGVQSVVAGVVLALLLFAYDVAAYEGMFKYNAVIFGIGYIIIFTLLGAALLFHLQIFKSSSQSDKILTYDDLYQPKK